MILKGFKAEDFVYSPKKSKDAATRVKPLYSDDEDYESLLRHLQREVSVRQDLLFADARHAVVVIFQGLDASGKDSAIKHVMTGFNPQDLFVTVFGPPSREELSHDFLWKAHQHMPPRGKMAIFNRSYYEEVLVVRAYPENLAEEKLPENHKQSTKKLFKHRLEDIVNFETYLCREGFQIIKIFLHVSKEEQRERFITRIEDPKKNWKFDPSDVRDRDNWKEMQKVYQECFEATSTREAPWYIIPADDKPNARLMIAALLADAFDRLPLRYPSMSEEKLKEMKRARKKLGGGK